MAIKIFFLLLFPFVVYGQQQNKHEQYALLIGIGQYPQQQTCHWGRLRGRTDVDSIQAVLLRKKFPTENIFPLCDELATKEGIIKGFQRLTETVRPGSVVFVYFSTHGQQITDDNGDEIVDKMDECIIPYDCPLYETTGSCPPPTNYRGEKHLRDDTIGIMLSVLRKKLGPSGQVMVVMDACHAGSGTRSLNSEPKGTPLGFDNLEPATAKEMKNSLTTEGGMSTIDQAPMICLFAQLPDEKTIDTVFTDAVCASLQKAGENTTYKEFIENVVSLVNSKTAFITPNYEDIGGLYQKPLFAGVMQNWLERIPIKSWNSTKEVKIGLGTFSNVFEGTHLEFFDANDSVAVVTGDVFKAYADKAYVRLSEEIPISQQAGVWGKIVKWVVSDKRLGVRNELTSIELSQAVATAFDNNPNFDLHEANSGYRILEDSHNIIIARYTDILTTYPKGSGNTSPEFHAETILRFLLQYQRQETLRQLSYQSEEVRVKWEIVPMDSHCVPNRQKTFDYDSSTFQYPLLEDVYFGVEITNTSHQKVYFALLDFPAIQHSSLENTVLIPYPDMTATEFYLPPGKTWLSEGERRCWRTVKPLGKETLKLVTSSLPLQNLRQAVATRSVTENIERVNGADLYDVSHINLVIQPK